MDFIMLLTMAFVLVLMAFLISKTKKPILTAIKSSGLGIISLLLVNLTSSVTGCYIMINIYSAFIASVLSLPGVVALIFMRLVFHY